MIARLDRFLNTGIVRFFLAVLIVVSVLPLDEVRRLDVAFLCLFSVEVALRAVVIFLGRTRPRAADVALLIVDAVAVLSFLPQIDRLFDGQYLRLLRLVRLTLLLRYISALARDLWSIVWRHEVRYQMGFLLGGVVLLTLLSGVVLHALEVKVDLDNDGKVDPASLADLFWWAFRQIESADNLAQNVHGPIEYVLLSIFLTVAGVFVMALIIGVGSSVVQELLASNRGRPVEFAGHLAVVGRGPNLRYLLVELTRILRKRRRREHLVVLSDSPEPPAYLNDGDLRRVTYRSGNLSDHRSLKLVNPGEASKIVVLYDQEKGAHADAQTLSTVLALRETTPCRIYLELRHRSNAAAAVSAGGGAITPIPLAKVLGSILAENLVFPGIDRLYEELLTAEGSDLGVTLFDARERARLVRRGGTVDFAGLLTEAYLRHGVVIIGVVEGDVATALRLNPLVAPGDGAGPGAISCAALAGLVGVCRDERDLARCRRLLLRPPPPHQADDGPATEVALCEPLTALTHALVVGENENLPTLLEETSLFRPGVSFTVAVAGRGRGDQLARQLQRRMGAALAPVEGGAGLRYLLRGGGALSILAAEEDIIGAIASDDRLRASPPDAAVFLADNVSPDPDAANLLWLFKLMEQVDAGRIPVGPRFHVVAEILSSAKGEIVERRFTRDGLRRVRAISTQKFRTYLMAHSCFDPLLFPAYAELVSAEGFEFCQVKPVGGGVTPSRQSTVESAGGGGETTFAALMAGLARQGMILVGYETGDTAGSPPVINPPPRGTGARIDLSRVAHLYVVADTDRMGGAACGGGSTRGGAESA